MSALDYAVIAIYIVGVTAIGFLAGGRRQTSLSEYFLGGRSVPWLAGAASLIATGISAKSLIGMPGLSYSRDLTYLQMYLVLPFAALVAAWVFLPFYSRMRITSAYEYLGRRFSPAVQSYGSILFQIETAFVLGTVIAAPSLVMSEAAGIPYHSAVSALLVATVLYTTFGGMKAVIWTDVAQFAVFAAAPLAILGYLSSNHEGGIGALVRIASEQGKLRTFDFSFDLAAEVTFWGAVGSMFFWHAGNQCVNQVLIQRYMTAPTPADSRRAILWGSAGIVLLWALFFFIGVILFAWNTAHPGAVPAGSHPDRVFTAFVMSTLPSGLKGAFLAAAFAAGMSTLSSMLNSMGTVTLVDVWKLHFDDGADEPAWLRRARWLTAGWGVFSFAAAFFVLQFGTVITAGIKFGSVITGALLGMFLLGIFVKRAGSGHVIAGSIIGMGAVGYTMAASTLSWSWYCGIGAVVTFLAGGAMSLLTPSRRDVSAYCYGAARVSCLLAAAGLASGQGNFGSITGDVTDQSGAAVPNAEVKAVNRNTGLSLATRTTSAGNYAIPNVPNGEYSVQVTAPSFKQVQQTAVIVSTATTTTVNVKLEVGNVTESVTVEESSSRIETTTSGVGTLLNERAYKQLPLDITGMDQGSSGIRQPQQFIFLTPGVTGTSFAHRMSGSQQNSESLQIDGHNWMLLNNPGRMVSNPPPFDAIEEFKINTAQYSAENPTGTGGTQLTFKSGTDQFHGGLFHLSRNDYFNAKGFFARQTAPLKLNESSASLGGPVIVPGYNGKQRTHFYFTATRFSRRGQENAASLITVPAAEFKRGDFSAWVDQRGAQIPIFDPASTRQNGRGGFTRDPFPANAIPANRIGAVGRNAAALMAAPSLPGVLNNLVIIASTKEDWKMYSAKVDHSWTGSQITRLTMWFMRRDREVISGYPGILAPDSTTVVDNRNVMLSHTSIVSPRVVNEARWSLAPWIPNQRNLGPYEQSGTTALGIPNHPVEPGVTPRLTIGSLSPALGNSNLIPFFSTRRNFSFGDTLSWVRGRHQLKFGFTNIISFDDTQRWLNRVGAFTFSNLSTSQPDAATVGAWGHGFASFLLGEVFNANRLINDAWDRERVRRFESFVQDDLKVSRKLTLNLGMRYHIPFPFIDGENRISALDLSVPNTGAGGRPGALVFAGTGQGRTGSRALAPTYYKAFEPRFGFAYAIAARTVLRGGYGVYYGFAPSNTTINGSPREGFTFDQDVRSLNQGITPAFNINQGFPAANVTLPRLIPTLRNGTTAVHVHPQSGRPPISLNWSFGFQRELPFGLAADAAYVANKGSRLPAALENLNQLNPELLRLGPVLNQNITSQAARDAGVGLPYPGFTGTVGQALRPYPQFTNIDNTFQGTGYSSYHSLQVKVDKRFSSGLMWMNAYTLAKLIDTGGSARGAEDPTPLDTFNRNLEKALAPDDQTHTLVTSVIYELPFGGGKPWLAGNRVLANALGNWRIAGSLRYFSGRPLSIGSGQPLPLFGGGNRVHLVGGTPIRPETGGDFDPNADLWLSRQAFAEPAPFTFGTLGRTLPNVRGPAFANENLSMTKYFRFRERHQLELRATLHNAFNRTVLANPNTALNSPAFGRIAGQANLPRQIELNLQYRF